MSFIDHLINWTQLSPVKPVELSPENCIAIHLAELGIFYQHDDADRDVDFNIP